MVLFSCGTIKIRINMLSLLLDTKYYFWKLQAKILCCHIQYFYLHIAQQLKYSPPIVLLAWLELFGVLQETIVLHVSAVKHMWGVARFGTISSI